MSRLMAIILTHNEERYIADCIASVRFADSVLVFDDFSTDATYRLAQAAGADVVQRKLDDFASQRNAALEVAVGQAEWVLFVDADERVLPELAEEVRTVLAQDDYAGWRIPRHNYIFGRLTRGAGWYPDYQTRLLRVGAARYDPKRKVHEVVILDGAEGTLTAHLIHYNYDNASQFYAKQRRYTAYEAGILHAQGRRPKPHNFILQPLRQFIWRFITLHGYRDGWHGIRLCVLMAWYEWQKYWLLRQMWGAPQPERPEAS